MEPKGYFLNEMAKFEFRSDICRYYINNFNERKRNECNIRVAASGGASDIIVCCIMDNNNISYGEVLGKMAEVNDWLKSANTPFYNDINNEIFVKGNSKFLGFYKVNGQEHYVFVEERE